MSTELKDQLDYIEKSSEKVTQYFSLAFVILGPIFIVLNFIYPSNLMLPLVIATVIAIAGYLSHVFNKHSLGQKITLGGFLLIIYYGAYYSSSAPILSLASLIIVASVLSRNKKLPHIFIASTMFVTAALVVMGRMTIEQTIIQPYNISLTNTIQASVLINICAYVIAIYIQRILIKTIVVQKKQYNQLQDLQKIMLSQAQQDTIKILAGGFSHDFNNILTILTTNISLMKEDKRIPPDIVEGLVEIEQASYKARNLSSQLLNLVRDDQNLIQNIYDIPDLIEKTVNFSIKGSNSQANFEFSEDLWGISADPVQLSQVIQNLVINADQAMNRSGMLTITAKNNSAYVDGLSIDPSIPAGDYVEIHVIDEGSGIPTDIQEKIFDIYFTTKDKGAGIGLAICKNIIENHHGYLGFNSEEGKGSDFVIFLPAVTTPKPIVPKGQSMESDPFEATVLIYDDNKDVIRSLRRLLQSLDLEVYDASDSESFILLMETMIKQKISMDIFILDLILPGDIGGEKMVKIIREMVKNPYIVVSSGYSVDFIVTEYKQYMFDNILRKPYNIDEVREIMREYIKHSKESLR